MIVCWENTNVLLVYLIFLSRYSIYSGGCDLLKIEEVFGGGGKEVGELKVNLS